jgi:hypothetical protein
MAAINSSDPVAWFNRALLISSIQYKVLLHSNVAIKLSYTFMLLYMYVWLCCAYYDSDYEYDCLVQSNPNLDYPTPGAKKMHDQSTNCDHMTNLRMRSKPTSRSCLARTSCCTATKSSSNAQGSTCSKVSVLSIEYEIKIIEMLDKSVLHMYTFLHTQSKSRVWLGRSQRYPNFLLIRTRFLPCDQRGSDNRGWTVPSIIIQK